MFTLKCQQNVGERDPIKLRKACEKSYLVCFAYDEDILRFCEVT